RSPGIRDSDWTASPLSHRKSDSKMEDHRNELSNEVYSRAVAHIGPDGSERFCSLVVAIRTTEAQRRNRSVEDVQPDVDAGCRRSSTSTVAAFQLWHFRLDRIRDQCRQKRDSARTGDETHTEDRCRKCSAQYREYSPYRKSD